MALAAPLLACPLLLHGQDAGAAPSQAAPAAAPVVREQPISAPPAAAVAAAPQDDDSAKPKHDKPAKAERPKVDDDTMVKAAQTPHPVLWSDPGDVAHKDLFFGQGGEKHQPKPPFTFEDENKSGSNPKFHVHDADGKKWDVKVGEEPRPEVASSRLLWAVGYFTQDDYLLPSAHIDGLRIGRKSADIHGEDIAFARFARKPGGQYRIGHWKWTENPFLATEEYDGLRVMMALINNWDLKDDNNDVYQDDKADRQIFFARDIGASFGTNGLSWTRGRSKGNLGSFKGSKFIIRNDGRMVDFGTPAAPTAHLAKTFGFDMHDYVVRHGMENIGHNIPLEHVRWIAKYLKQLTHQQIVDAFRAGDFPPDVQAEYVGIVESRIAELAKL